MIKPPKTNKFYIPKANVNVKTRVITEPDIESELEPNIETDPLLVMKSESKVKELVNKIESKLSS